MWTQSLSEVNVSLPPLPASASSKQLQVQLSATHLTITLRPSTPFIPTTAFHAAILPEDSTWTLESEGHSKTLRLYLRRGSLCLACVLLSLWLCVPLAAAARRLQPSDVLASFAAAGSTQHARWGRALRTSSVPNSRLPSSPSPSTLLYPVDYGADPTGVADSTSAFAALMAPLLSPTRFNHNHRLANGNVDLGGATVDLQGGDFLLSAPLLLPFCFGNVRFQRGTLRASPTFPPSSYFVELGHGDAEQCKATEQDTTLENVAVSELMLDGAQVASGCLRISVVMGAVLGPNNLYLGFTRAGLTVSGGHEVQISASWMGQFTYDYPRKERGTAMGIELLGNDHVISDVVVFSAQTGIDVRGAANLIVNAHTWNQATGNHGVGIFLDCAGYATPRTACWPCTWTGTRWSPSHLSTFSSPRVTF